MDNSVELIGWYGGDVINACSAWTSTSRDLTDEKKNRIPALLKMLAENGHETPFEKSIVHFLINTDIATHIQICKHRISSLNAESARYKELKEDKYYLPKDWKSIKASRNVSISTMFGDEWIYKYDWLDILKEYTQLGNTLYHECLKDLEPILGRKRSKESARFFKTYNSQIEGDLMFNWRSFINFQTLRNSEHAQGEIRDLAQKMLDLVRNIEGEPFKYTIEAFGL
jgi:flavin-dependent thymidylate synthase